MLQHNVPYAHVVTKARIVLKRLAGAVARPVGGVVYEYLPDASMQGEHQGELWPPSNALLLVVLSSPELALARVSSLGAPSRILVKGLIVAALSPAGAESLL